MFPAHLIDGSGKPPFQFPVLKFGRSRFPKVMFTVTLDTLGLSSFAAVAAITITAFNLDGVIETRTILLDYDQQQRDLGREVNAPTLRFWLEEASASRRFILTEQIGNRLLADDAISVFADFIYDHKARAKEARTLVWTKGIKLEASILEQLAADYDTDLGITYQEWADLRTLSLLTGVTIGRFDGTDGAPLTAPEQALKVIEGLQKLNLD
jgi:hypothetical protein